MAIEYEYCGLGVAHAQVLEFLSIANWCKFVSYSDILQIQIPVSKYLDVRLCSVSLHAV